MRIKWYTVYVWVIFLVSCGQENKPLPILGNPDIRGKDTTYPTIAEFSLINQEGQTVTNKTFDGKIYVADFIFLSCPTICPKMTREMHTAYRSFEQNDHVRFLSHTIDPEHDTIPRLKAYADDLGVLPDKWHFVTGNQDSIITLAERSYFATAYPDSSSPGGFTHSGSLLLVDKHRHIRGVYNGTSPAETKRLVSDIQILLKEQF